MEHTIQFKCLNCNDMVKVEVQEVSSGILLKAVNIVNIKLTNATSLCPKCTSL